MVQNKIRKQSVYQLLNKDNKMIKAEQFNAYFAAVFSNKQVYEK